MFLSSIEERTRLISKGMLLRKIDVLKTSIFTFLRKKNEEMH